MLNDNFLSLIALSVYAGAVLCCLYCTPKMHFFPYYFIYIIYWWWLTSSLVRVFYVFMYLWFWFYSRANCLNYDMFRLGEAEVIYLKNAI